MVKFTSLKNKLHMFIYILKCKFFFNYQVKVLIKKKLAQNTDKNLCKNISA